MGRPVRDRGMSDVWCDPTRVMCGRAVQVVAVLQDSNVAGELAGLILHPESVAWAELRKVGAVVVAAVQPCQGGVGTGRSILPRHYVHHQPERNADVTLLSDPVWSLSMETTIEPARTLRPPQAPLDGEKLVGDRPWVIVAADGNRRRQHRRAGRPGEPPRCPEGQTTANMP